MSNISVYEIKSGHYDYQHIWRSYPNSANGVTIRFKYKNNSTKTMKYVFLSFVPYNNVDDVVASDIGGFNQTRIKITGPIEPGMSKEGSCKNAFYNSSIVRCELVKAEIEYMDGTKERILIKPFLKVLAAAMLRRLCMDHTTVRRSGHYAATVTIPLHRHGTEEHL